MISVRQTLVILYNNNIKGKQEADQHSAIISFRLEKEYTTIKNKEMEEQIEIKVCVCV